MHFVSVFWTMFAMRCVAWSGVSASSSLYYALCRWFEVGIDLPAYLLLLDIAYSNNGTHQSDSA